MDATLSRSTWLSLLKTVEPAAARNTSNNPILGCVKMALDEENLSLFVTDTELAIRVSHPAQDCGPCKTGVCLVPLDRFRAIVNASPEDSIRVFDREDKIQIAAEKSRFALPSYKADEYPDYGDIANPKATVAVKSKDLTKIISRVKPSAGESFTCDGKRGKFATECLLLEIHKGRLYATGSDTKSLSVASIALNDSAASAASVLLLPSTCNAILRVLDSDTDCTLSFAANQLGVATSRVNLSATLFNGRYPPWRDILAQSVKQTSITAVAEPAGLLAALRQVCTVVDQASQRVEMKWGEALKMEAVTPEKGQGDVELLLASYQGKEVTTAIDPSYLTEMLAARVAEKKGGELLGIKLPLEFKPIVLEFGDDWHGLIMPLEPRKGEKTS
jgi:DNA polymerase III sliding clamp (beta) subunit (PCNA family)